MAARVPHVRRKRVGVIFIVSPVRSEIALRLSIESLTEDLFPSQKNATQSQAPMIYFLFSGTIGNIGA
jgi:hypothetical protein